MIRQGYNRNETKRRNVLDHRKKQFADPAYKEAQYPHRLNIYAESPTADITLEQFEQWAIDRLRGMFCLQSHRLTATVLACLANVGYLQQSLLSLTHAHFAIVHQPRQPPI